MFRSSERLCPWLGAHRGCAANRGPARQAECGQCCQSCFTVWCGSHLIGTHVCFSVVAALYFLGVFGVKWLCLHGQDVAIPT